MFPLSAVTTIVITVDPTANAIGLEWVLLATVFPCVVSVANASFTVALTVTEVVVYFTVDVYVS